MQRLWPADRRGAVSLIFAVSATAFFGFAALATEAGSWYLVRRNAQNAADAAAMAGVIALQLATPANRAAKISAVGADLAAQNGFANDTGTMVAVRHPPTSGAQTGNQAAVEVQITQAQPLLLADLFLDEPPVVSVRAVAVLQDRSRVCLLALTGSVTIQNSSSFSADGCAVGSNSTGAAAINIPQSNSSVVAQSMISAGGCSGCGRSSVRLSRDYQEYAVPSTNVYAHLDAKPAPAVASCHNTGPLNVNGPLTPYNASQRKAYCDNVTVSNTSSVTFPSGTYVFRDASLTIGSISSFTCLNCTFLFIGANPGRLSISNLSSARITAPAANTLDADYDGMLFYRASSGTTGNSGSPTLNLQNVSSFDLAGGIYFPGAYVRMGNVSSVSNADCLPIVGGTLDIGNLSSFRISVAGCAAYGTPVPAQQGPRLVE
ncbi:pilus assembly protein TadG-related protein [Geminicoccus harenae]|uniref:pilus assembly protein TadG-related protein n=1 Tax=Geminicoccus harenae TaxID=2498453 RepID=UPI00168BA723|nr:pilus assembly protein TadG-related protein [Geminicoccus harenae]